MQLGLVGLSRMGASMRDRLTAAGHHVVGYDHDPSRSDATSLADLCDRLSPPRVVWLMVPVAVTGQVINDLAELLEPGDLVIDGGNSHYQEAAPRAEQLGQRRIGYLDVGVSGGIWGATHGYALMVGGEPRHVQRCMPIFEALKPEGEFGFVHAGGVGAGHFAKMIHNGIEYGLMQAYAEGYELLTRAELVTDAPAVLRSWRDGSVIRSWLLDLLDRALADDPKLAEVRAYVEDTGEGRWVVEEAVRRAVPIPALTAALFTRFSSRQSDRLAMKAVAALREQFGGHPIRR